MSDVESFETTGGHVVELRDVGGEARYVCRGCFQEGYGFGRFNNPCPVDAKHPLRVVPVAGPDDRGRTWHAAAVLMGSHRHVSVRHGVEGSRALLGKLVCDEDVWPQLRAALETLGDVSEAQA